MPLSCNLGTKRVKLNDQIDKNEDSGTSGSATGVEIKVKENDKDSKESNLNEFKLQIKGDIEKQFTLELEKKDAEIRTVKEEMQILVNNHRQMIDEIKNQNKVDLDKVYKKFAISYQDLHQVPPGIKSDKASILKLRRQKSKKKARRK